MALSLRPLLALGEMQKREKGNLPTVVAQFVEQRTRDSMFKGLNGAVAGICRKQWRKKVKENFPAVGRAS